MISYTLIEEIDAAYRRLSAATEELATADRAGADLDLQHARREVERLHLIVRPLGTRASGGIHS